MRLSGKEKSWRSQGILLVPYDYKSESHVGTTNTYVCCSLFMVSLVYFVQALYKARALSSFEPDRAASRNSLYVRQDGVFTGLSNDISYCNTMNPQGEIYV